MTVQPEAPETEERSGLSRRTVIKGAAHAAWAIPAVQLVTSVASAGTFSGPANLAGGVAATQTSTWTGNNKGASFGAQVQVTNKGGQATQALIVTLTFGSTYKLTVSGVTDGWAASGSGTNTISFTAGTNKQGTSQQAPAGGSTSFSATFSSTGSSNSGQATTADVFANPGGTSSTPGSATLSIAKK